MITTRCRRIAHCAADNAARAANALLVVAGVLTLLAGCSAAGNGQGLDENGNLIGQDGGGGNGGGGNGGGGASGNPNATLTWVQTNVFGGVCTQCHTGAGAPLGVDWSSESASCSNVGRASGEIPAMLEIESGNPDASYLIWKLDGAGPNGEPIVGVQMPMSNPPLTAETVQNVRDWISDDTPGCPKQFNSASAQSFSDPGRTITAAAASRPSWSDVSGQALRFCASCHSINPLHPSCSLELVCPPRGLVLTDDNYYGIVDGVFVAPSDPEGSLLWHRIDRANALDSAWHGPAALTSQQKALVFRWILAGAPRCHADGDCQ